MVEEHHVQTEAGLLTLRAVETLQETSRLVDLQREIWGYGRAGQDFPYPARALFAIAESGGHVVAALIDGRPVAMSLAWMGMLKGTTELHLHSQLMGVVEEFRHAGVGYHLKLYQRDYALSRGLSLIRWTFDPLRSPNANLNIRKLGAIVKHYHPDYYGRMDSEFTRGLSTDRVWAEWYVNSNRVKERLSGPPAALEQEPSLFRISLTETRNGVRFADFDLQDRETTVLVEIPHNYEEISQQNLPLAREWQAKIREIFQYYLSQGYAMADFLLVSGNPRKTLYLLSKEPLEKILSRGHPTW